MDRRKFLTTTAAGGAAVVAQPYIAHAAQHELLVAEPVHSTRYLLKKWGLDAKTDVTVVETANSAILAAVKGKRAQIGCSTEPFITQGVKQGIWSEPFFNVPKELGPYAYSTINIRLDSITKEP